MSIDSFKKDIDLAAEILGSNTGYIFNRKLIDKLFENSSPSLEDICIRLIAIDSLYSTNMSKRLFGIQDLASAIYDIGNDVQLENEILKYKKKEESKIDGLLSAPYGIEKKDAGKKDAEGKEARSLISKYLYFVAKHDFPIEDSLVKENIEDALKYYGVAQGKNGEDLLYFLISFCADNGIFLDKFDNFMWLLGKINKGSLYLIVEKDAYCSIFEKLEIHATKSSEIDDEVSRKLKIDSTIEEILVSDELREFLRINKKIHKEK